MKLFIFLNLLSLVYSWNLVSLKNKKNNFIYKKHKFIAIDNVGVDVFYTLGVCSYIKSNYNTSEYMYIGTSNGAWSSLIMACKFPVKEIVTKYINYINFDKINSISSFQYCFKDFFFKKL